MGVIWHLFFVDLIQSENFLRLSQLREKKWERKFDNLLLFQAILNCVSICYCRCVNCRYYSHSPLKSDITYSCTLPWYIHVLTCVTRMMLCDIIVTLPVLHAVFRIFEKSTGLWTLEITWFITTIIIAGSTVTIPLTTANVLGEITPSMNRIKKIVVLACYVI